MIKRKNIQYYKNQNNTKFSSVEFRKAIELKRINKKQNDKNKSN